MRHPEPSDPAPHQVDKYLALDGLRGVAAAVVGVSHMRHLFLDRGGIENAALAVDFFFMLSGFVLAHAYADKLNAGGYFSNYLLRRFIRLYPLVLAATLIGVIPYIFGQYASVYLFRLVVQGFLLLPEPWLSPIDPSTFPLNPPAWSLLLEMVASVLFGVGLWRSARLRWLLVLLLAGSIFIAATVLSNRTLDVGWAFSDIHWGLARVLFAFGAGVALHRFRHRLEVPPLPLPVLSLILCMALLSPTQSRLFLLFVSFVLFPFLVLSAVRCETRFRRLAYWSGEMSYPFYILHWPISNCLRGMLVVFPVALPAPVIIGLAFASVVIGSFVLLVCFDRPVRVRLGKRLARHRVSASGSTLLVAAIGDADDRDAGDHGRPSEA